VALEVSGNFTALKLACRGEKGARIVQVGTLPHEPLPFVVNELMAKELDLAERFAGNRVRLGGLVPCDAPGRRAAASDRTVSIAGRVKAFALAKDKSQSTKVRRGVA
jgi:hypothetical protein